RTMATVASEVSEPTLIILEAGTGQGKTEAALAAAQILGRNVGAQGIYFAAPTMATANGLLERTLRWASRSGQDNTVASMYLAHSKNQLAQEYRQLKLRGIAPEESERGGEVVASSWMSGRRRGLLSNIVVGTVDQVLMMALQQRYSMLRHIALAGKVVIFDEVHSFDTYTSVYLERTLEWLAYYGVSVIMLSATLPRGRREALIEAYTGERPTESHDAYPLISIASESSLRFEAPEPPPPELTARVQLLDDDLPTVTDTLEDLLADGGCALITCNTIARAQETYSAVSELFPGEAELHHAGFMAWERTQREDALRRKLGPASHLGQGRPDRLIVVATQVAEQSLDIDADVLITDIAPMDLLIQRAGRIHRHDRPASDRPEKLRTPRIYVRGITQTDPVPEFDGGAEAIYGARLLLATLLRLPEQFNRPDDVPDLVQSVYGDIHDIPEAWETTWNDALHAEQEREDRAQSRARDFRIPTPFQEQDLASLFGRCVSAAIHLGDEERGAAQVRDAEPTVEVIPIVRTQYGYRPLGDHPEILETGELSYAEAFHLASSVVRLPARMTRYTNDFEAVVGTLEERTPPHWQNHFLLKGQLALPLDEDHFTQLGRFWVRYSTELGLEHGFEKEGRMSAP
ncbi:CRISPR-associated helicase Cas3', partial [Corynebacterium sp.]|uniref:CRISPR-associated helicase Cas3' n=1 Tax=Corynebacterium sp. TaxID=1720 RepID=UPI002A913D19